MGNATQPLFHPGVAPAQGHPLRELHSSLSGASWFPLKFQSLWRGEEA